MGWQQGARSKKKCSKCSIGQQHQAGRRSILYQDLNYRLVSSKLPNHFFGALVMRVLQPTNLNTIEPAILKLHLGKPSGELWWITMMTLVMVSLFDQFVPFSSFEWKAKIWIGSHLILQYNFSRKKDWFVNSQWDIRNFLKSDWMMKVQIQCWKIKSAPVKAQTLLSNVQAYEFAKFWKFSFFRKYKKFCEINLVKLPEFPGLLLLLSSFWLPSFWLVDFLAIGWQHFEAIKDLVLYFSILSEKAQIRPTCHVGHFRIYFWRV